MTDLLVMHDILDVELESSDERRVGRVADLLCRHAADGTLTAVALSIGAEADLRRIASSLGRAAHRRLKGRFERTVSIGEIVEFGDNLRLRERAAAYDLDDGDAWAAGILRFIPGSGNGTATPEATARGRAASTERPRRGDVWISDLIGTQVVDTDGQKLGHVVELLIGRRHHRVNAILAGSYGWIGRFGISTLVHRLGWWGGHQEIAWDRVKEIHRRRIVVQPEPR